MVLSFSFSFWDLAVWFAGTSLIMLVTTEFLGPQLRRNSNTNFDVKKLRTVALIFGIAFVFIIGIRILTLTIK